MNTGEPSVSLHGSKENHEMDSCAPAGCSLFSGANDTDEAAAKSTLMNREHIIIHAENLKKHFPLSSGGLSGKKKILKAVDGVSLDICEGEILGVVGESGCGKSTLGRALLRLFPVTEGTLLFDGTDISRLGRKELKPYRRNMQMIFQNPYSSFNPRQRIYQALSEVGHVYGMTAGETGQRIHDLMDYISLPEEILYRSPSELSGGQLQRLAIARALLLNPKFIVADEPVSALDVSVQAQILNLIVDLRKKFRMTMLFISHEMTVVEHICDVVAVMYLGRIVEIAPSEELFSHLLHPYTQALMSAIPKADPEDLSGRIILEGDIPNAIDLPEGCSFASRCRYCTQQCRRERPSLRETGMGHLTACHLVSQFAR